ncbi:hypothetical protein C8R47DRAFT_1065327 [Mycena vitilis]|nr:hypothetical protein C8R47DRAFT_1065327 [Mycena vitilis]
MAFPDSDYPRSAAIWFEDGNIIIRTRTRMFRLYKGLLAHKSAFFRSLVSQPKTDEETIDGCSVIDMNDDADELEIFLSTIINGIFRRDAAPSAPPSRGIQPNTRDVACVLKTATKFRATNIQIHCVGYLEHLFPMRVQEWDLRCAREDIYSLCEALVVADTLELHWMVPTICCRIIAGTAKTDDALRFIPPDILLTLPLTQQLRILRGSPTFLGGSRYILDWMRNSNSLGWDICTVAGCEDKRRELLNQWSEDAPIDPFAFGAHKQEIWDQVRDHWRTGREELWDALPMAFGFESWDKLEDQRLAWRSLTSD